MASSPPSSLNCPSHKKVMREFPEPESCGANDDDDDDDDGDDDDGTNRKKRSRTGNRCDGWLTGEAPPNNADAESRLQRSPSPPPSAAGTEAAAAPLSSPSHLTAAAIFAASAALAAKTREAIAAVTGTPSASPPLPAHLETEAASATAGEGGASASSGVLGRKRRSCSSSCAVVPSPDTRARVSDGPRGVNASTAAEVMRVLGREKMMATPAASDGDGGHDGAVSSVAGGVDDGEEDGGGEDGGGGDWSCSGHEVVDGGAGDAAAVAVTPRGRGMIPPDPDTVRARLDDYMEVRPRSTFDLLVGYGRRPEEWGGGGGGGEAKRFGTNNIDR